ncbi:hypothetical protein [Rhodanobacter sp. MP1X3]|uniref:hypothetical protein n=1 Tax=Rhodanobacter sp. MP1X3 TaxID=2723086 RepID=UPI001622A6E6|nr:hypothetical protein [Rhodanobacter sp. MP1X3]MBB6243719.1 hypothetical protein [Rhodanobacter sp. MP1X3]
MDKQNNPLKDRIDRAAAKLATLKAQQQVREAQEKARHSSKARATRNRALVLWGVAMECEVLDDPERIDLLRAILEKHLKRENERTAALGFLGTLKLSAPTPPAMANNQNSKSQQ